MFWVQEIGNSNNSKYKLFYAEEISDVQKLPTNINKGTQVKNEFIEDLANERCALGSECFVFEDSTLRILSISGWKKIE